MTLSYYFAHHKTFQNGDDPFTTLFLHNLPLFEFNKHGTFGFFDNIHRLNTMNKHESRTFMITIELILY